MEFEAGQRVNTPLGQGVVLGRRMAPPGYTRVAAYHVRLDSRAKEAESDPTAAFYRSTAFDAADVWAIE